MNYTHRLDRAHHTAGFTQATFQRFQTHIMSCGSYDLRCCICILNIRLKDLSYVVELNLQFIIRSFFKISDNPKATKEEVGKAYEGYKDFFYKYHQETPQQQRIATRDTSKHLMAEPNHRRVRLYGENSSNALRHALELGRRNKCHSLLSSGSRARTHKGRHSQGAQSIQGSKRLSQNSYTEEERLQNESLEINDDNDLVYILPTQLAPVNLTASCVW
ncbi:5526_t:CDS:2, partial [Paraglomus occultum]